MRVTMRDGTVRSARPRSFANGWIAVDYTDGRQPEHGVVDPVRARLETMDEVDMFANRDHLVVGSFWQEYQLGADGRFTAIVDDDRRPPAGGRRRRGSSRRRR